MSTPDTQSTPATGQPTSASTISTNSPARTLVRYGLYPFSWGVVLAGFYAINALGEDPRRVWGAITGGLALTYLVLEFLVPFEKRWSMTLRSFLADFKFLLTNSVAVALFSSFMTIWSINISGENVGPASNWPIGVQLLAALVIYEFINYWLHRGMHEMTGPLGRILWRTHAAHHLPPRLYLVMHAVGHPINGIIIQGIAIVLPIWLMGYSPEAVGMFLLITSMHGLISHFNVDVRMGQLNYVFVGPELHRYHHSADVNEAKNFGNTLSIYDWIFGTFVYHPGEVPQELGVSADAKLPAYERYFAVLHMPFQRRKAD